MSCTPPSPWPWIDRPVSGLFPETTRPIQTRFPYAYPTRLSLPLRNNSLTHYTKGTQSQNKSAPTACMHPVSGSISLPSPGFFSPFPHGTSSLSVSWEYLALEDGPPMFRQGFSCPALLVASLVPHSSFRVRGYHPLLPSFPECSTNSCAITCRLLPVRSPLLRESQLISVPKGT